MYAHIHLYSSTDWYLEQVTFKMNLGFYFNIIYPTHSEELRKVLTYMLRGETGDWNLTNGQGMLLDKVKRVCWNVPTATGFFHLPQKLDISHFTGGKKRAQLTKKCGEITGRPPAILEKEPDYIICSWKVSFLTFLQERLRQMWDNFFCTLNTIMQYFKHYDNAMLAQEEQHI